MGEVVERVVGSGHGDQLVVFDLPVVKRVGPGFGTGPRAAAAPLHRAGGGEASDDEKTGGQENSVHNR